ncbi:hypothetical protein DL762_009363 [Monosporascus cannonballus]|uniref:Uncharacterized protein n=1 Tax=Monosporascus cannonballus TaxID=155416 RepID=A0ABY0GTJ9_9PEZI|nr:hypothetical protein DL762_009363 [Monosporascus cannonballus]
MAYNAAGGGGYPGKRPYPGPPAPRPMPPRGPPAGYAPPSHQQQQQQQQKYEHYQEEYGYEYDQYDNGYAQDYGPPQEMNHGRGRPPPPGQGYHQQDMYGPRPGAGPGSGGRPPPPGGRGGQMRSPPRGSGPPPPGPGRGYPPSGRGRPGPGPPDRAATMDPSMSRRGPPNEQGYGSPGPFPPMPGHGRRPDFEQDQQLADRMADMNMNGGRPGMPHHANSAPGRAPRQPPPPMDHYSRPSMDSQRSGGGRGPPQQGYPEPRRGPPPPQDQGYGYQDDGYGVPMSPVRDGFGPPARSMTMPVDHGESLEMYNSGPPSRMASAASAPPGGPRHPPQRPSTAQGNRPPPQRMYPDQPPPPLPLQYNNNQYNDNPNNYQERGWEEEPGRGSYGDVYDNYYDQGPGGNQYAPANPARNDMPDFDAAPPQDPRASFDQHIRAGPARQPTMRQPGMPQPGPARVAEISRAKSQPNLREPQTAIFEMAPDLPPLPPGGFVAYNGQAADRGLPNNPPPIRPGHQGGGPPPTNSPAPSQAGPGSGHPAPIRPGLMQNSMVSINDKPAPVRNYSGGTPPAAAAGALGRPQPLPQSRSGKPGSAAEKVPVTVDELDRLRAIVKNNPNDQKSALTLAKKLVEASDVLVPRLPDPKARTRSRERYVMDAHKILKKLVNAQNTDAMFFMADCTGRGAFGYEPDAKEAFTLYQSAAKLGHAAAAYRTAVCCELGSDDGGGTRKDPMKAMQWYKRAATLGDTPAMYKMGMILLKGLLGQEKDRREAIGWLKRAAERADTENPHAVHEMALLYESAGPNDPVLRDEAYALQLFKQAADLGYKFSQFRLGCVYEFGLIGCPIDARASIMWYSRAAQQEEHQAELALSGWYLTGSEGVLQQSDTEAYLWARKAAQAGLAKAEYAMGYYTEVGIGVPANLEDAKRWYWRAAAQDFPKARERLEDLKRSGRSGPRQRERISRSKMVGAKQQEGECSVM